MHSRKTRITRSRATLTPQKLSPDSLHPIYIYIYKTGFESQVLEVGDAAYRALENRKKEEEEKRLKKEEFRKKMEHFQEPHPQPTAN